jgi:hypothetical protein
MSTMQAHQHPGRRHRQSSTLDLVDALEQRQDTLDRLAPHLVFTRRRLETEIEQLLAELAARHVQAGRRRARR